MTFSTECFRTKASQQALSSLLLQEGVIDLPRCNIVIELFYHSTQNEGDLHVGLDSVFAVPALLVFPFSHQKSPPSSEGTGLAPRAAHR
jgi:hypothetical protein